MVGNPSCASPTRTWPLIFKAVVCWSYIYISGNKLILKWISLMISQIFREVVTIVFRERFAWNDHYYCNVLKKIISIFLKTCFWLTIFLLFTCFWSITCCVYISALKIDFEVILFRFLGDLEKIVEIRRFRVKTHQYFGSGSPLEFYLTWEL